MAYRKKGWSIPDATVFEQVRPRTVPRGAPWRAHGLTRAVPV